MDVIVVVLNIGLNIAFITFNLHHYCHQISPSLHTDVSLGWSLPPSVLFTGA